MIPPALLIATAVLANHPAAAVAAEDSQQQQQQEEEEEADQPFFPVFHIRPPAGHVNDPNGPFRDPRTGYIHLFMQYCPRGPCFGQKAPGNHTPNYQSATHFYSKDGGAHWVWTGNASGVVAACDPLSPGQCPPAESSTDCPDDLGVYSGSTTIVGGVPSYAYPGVHLYNYKGDPSAVTMTQCIATPANTSDPALARWKKRTIISHSQIPHGISQHFHDDSTAFQANGRWWIFMGSAVCGGQPTGDCPYPDPSVTRSRGHGVNCECGTPPLPLPPTTDNVLCGLYRPAYLMQRRDEMQTCSRRRSSRGAYQLSTQISSR
jgi:hypothetical protein